VNGPSGDWPDDLGDLTPGGGGSEGPDARGPGAGDVVTVEVGSASGRTENVEFFFRPGLVEVWYRLRCRAVLDRDLLRTWLAAPQAPLVVDGVALSAQRTVDSRGRAALDLPDVVSWTLAPDVLDRLRSRT
jgi:hypothetical protein